MKTILITGATGYIGLNILRRLIKDKQVLLIIIIRKNTNIEKINNLNGSFVFICVEEIIRENPLYYYKIDIIIHLATHYIYNQDNNNIDQLISSNVTLGTLILESVSLHSKLLFIYFSSSSIYANEYFYSPQSLYAATKRAFSDILEFYRKTYKFKNVELLIYDTYGSDDSRNKIIPKLIKALNFNHALDLSPGDQRLRLLHINDLIEAIILIINDSNLSTTSRTTVYTLGTEETYSLREIVKMIESISDKKLNVNFGALEYRVNEIMIPYPLKKLPRGWKPKIDLASGLKELINEK